MGLGGQVRVAGDVAGEIVGGELVARIKAVVLEIVGPLGERRPVRLGEIGVAFDLGERGHHAEHVAGFFDGHAAVRIAAAVNLAGGVRVGAQIVRGRVMLPARAGRVIHQRAKAGLEQVGAEGHHQRAGGVEHVDGGATAVGEVLFREAQRLAVGVGTDFLGGQRLAVGQHADLHVRLTAELLQVGHEFGIELFAALVERSVFLLGRLQKVGERGAVLGPVALQIGVEITDRAGVVVVGQDRVSGDGRGGDFAEVERRSQYAGLAGWHGGQVTSVGVERLAAGERGAGFGARSGRGGLAGAGDVEVAPVNALVVAPGFEHRLFDGADAQRRQFADIRNSLGSDNLLRLVDGQRGGGIQIHGDVMAVGRGRLGAVRDVGDRTRHHDQIVRQQRRQEGDGDLHAGFFEDVDRTRRQHGQADLLGGRCGVGGGAHEGECLAIDADETGEFLLVAGPVLGHLIVQFVGHRPDAEVRVIGDQRHGRRTLGLGEYAYAGDSGHQHGQACGEFLLHGSSDNLSLRSVSASGGQCPPYKTSIKVSVIRY